MRRGRAPSLRSADMLVLALALVLAALLTSPAWAKHVYSWRDDQGVLHFSDQRPPAEATEVKATRVQVDPREWLVAREERKGHLTTHHLRSLYGGAIEVEIDLQDADNTLTDPPLPHRVVIPAFSEAPLFTAGALSPGRYAYRYQYRHVPGPPGTRPSSNTAYALPFRSAQVLRIDQGFNGQFSHQDDYSRHAIDIGMPEGTPILAARAGVVMEIEEDFDGSGTDLGRYGDRANYIRILHADGSMAVYAHLRLESVRVSVGQGVNAGQQIGESGNTGYSTGPHLHFVIQHNAGMRVVSIPFRLQLGDTAVEPVQGMALQP